MSATADGFHPEEYGGPVIFALGFHALTILLLTVNLSFCETRVEVPVPPHVKAVVIDRTPPKPAVVPPKLRDVKIPEIEIPKIDIPPPPKPVAPVPKPLEKAVVKPKPVEVPKPVEAPKPVVPDFTAELDREQQAKTARDTTQRETAQREASVRSALNQKTVDEYKALIAAEIQRRWIPSPGARPGLKAVLRIALLPGGEVQEVTLVKSSGDSMFDKSAENAVRLAGRLPVPADPQLFNEFRRFTFTFEPRR